LVNRVNCFILKTGLTQKLDAFIVGINKKEAVKVCLEGELPPKSEPPLLLTNKGRN
jgi:hypothetical protein